MRKVLFGFVVVMAIGAALYLRSRRAKPALEVAYVANRDVILWNTSAPVRSSVTTTHYGQRLDVIDRKGDQAKVRTAAGTTGWTRAANLLAAELWEKAQDLDEQTAGAPVEARGHTRALANVHVGPGRDAPRVVQLSRGVPVELYRRKIFAATTSKKEDWWLIRARMKDQRTVAGWVLGQLVDLDVPSPLPDYTSAVGMRVVAWFKLNPVIGAHGTERPQYLVVGTRGPEGQPCDFTMLRVFTWSWRRGHYETAFVESGLCGMLPVNVMRFAATGEATFSFADMSGGIRAERKYRMRQTIVRRVLSPEPRRTAGRVGR